MQVTTIDLLRHGEPVGGRKYRGQTDDPLSDKGWGQMRRTVGDFGDWHHIVSSPLARCAAFAKELSEKHNIPLDFDERFKEVGFGAWEGRLPHELEAENPGILLQFKVNPVGKRPEGAEALHDFFNRVSVALDDVHRRHEGGHVLVVCHAGVIRMAMAAALGMLPQNGYRIQVDSASLTRVALQRGGDTVLPHLVFHNIRDVPKL